MKQEKLFCVAVVLSSWGYLFPQAQLEFESNKLELDKQAIKIMCGCYEVGFNFIETFSFSEDSLYKPSETKHMSALEWVKLLEDDEDKIVMQHLLIVGGDERPTIVKHWRQDWLYENQTSYDYDADNRWKYVSYTADQVKGKWTQRVSQVDDTPRYEGRATWVHVDGKSSWESKADAPLPRREHTVRNDYNVMKRTNHILVYNDHWIHDQDNDKIVRRNGEPDVLLAQEKGHNVYKKVADEKCIAAQKWWKENHQHWDSVRREWDEIFSKKEDIIL
ncbi:MAG: hypothetical protein OXC03_06720 [Flavobacteriaceae bacterium]|nr:hypothetical protein [Flavobacteriaceae bacterium]